MFSKKLLVVSISLLSAGAGLLWACADVGWDEYGVSAFAPEAFVDTAYTPFFYSDQFYYSIGHDEEHVTRFNDQVVADWSVYLSRPQTDTEVRYFLLQAGPATIDSANAYLAAPAATSRFAASPLLRDGRKDKRVKEFFTFLAYAKASESYAAVQVNYWDYDAATAHKPLDAASSNAAAAMADKVASLKDEFLKQRYWFQVVRAYFFDGEYADCIAFYDRYQAAFPDNKLSARALSYVAGAWYRQKKYAQANYLYSRVYDAGPEFKTVAHFSFHPQSDADWKETLKLCRNTKEQVTLWQLLGIYYDEQRAIKEIYALEPGSDKLNLLLSRLVNIEENRVSGYADYYGSGAIRPLKDSVQPRILALVTGIATAGNTAKPYMWQLAAGYLHFLYEQHKEAGEWLDKASKNMPANNLVRAEFRLFTFVNRVGAASVIDAKTEQLLLPDLQWLQRLAEAKESVPDFRFDAAYSWARMTLSRKYQKQKDYLKAECYNHQDTFYTDAAQVLRMKEFLSKSRASEYEQYCRDIYPVNAADISEFQAIQLAYRDKLPEAIALMKEGSGSATELLGNPFNGRIRDCHDCDHEAIQKVKYTKLSLLEKLQEMEANIAAGKEVYANSLLVANAYYNMTYYGNARYFYECKIIGGGESSSNYISNSFDKMLIDCRLTIAYYRKALAAAETEEQKAKCTFMLAKCAQNERYNREAAAGNIEAYGYSYFGPVDFKAFLAYKNTKYYQEVINECGYFRTYLGMK